MVVVSCIASYNAKYSTKYNTAMRCLLLILDSNVSVRVPFTEFPVLFHRYFDHPQPLFLQDTFWDEWTSMKKYRSCRHIWDNQGNQVYKH